MSLEQPNKLTNLVSLQQQLTALLVHFHTIDTNRRCSCSATHRYKVSKNSCQGRDFPSGHPARLSRQQLGHGQCPRAGSQACNRHPAHQPGQRSKWSVCEIPKPPKPPKALPRGPRGGLCLCITLHKKVCHRHYYKTRAHFEKKCLSQVLSRSKGQLALAAPCTSAPARHPHDTRGRLGDVRFKAGLLGDAPQYDRHDTWLSVCFSGTSTCLPADA